jgi:muramoyltetrapeptide carboxypeptidase
MHEGTPFLRPGDRVRLVAPSLPADPKLVVRFTRVLERWGLVPEVARHALEGRGFAAGTDVERAADLNEALRDPSVRAVFSVRGGKGAHRVVERIDYDAARRDPKPLVGFSDATIVHLALWKHCRALGVHGPDASWAVGLATEGSIDALRRALMTTAPIVLRADPRAETAALTTGGRATGVLLGGNLELIATAAGWALPSLDGAILLLEAIEQWPGHIDRVLTMLYRAGHLRGVRGVAVGHFTKCMTKGAWRYLDVLRDRLAPLGVPILGGLPVGHERDAASVVLGAEVTLDADAGTLDVPNVRPAASPGSPG